MIHSNALILSLSVLACTRFLAFIIFFEIAIKEKNIHDLILSIGWLLYAAGSYWGIVSYQNTGALTSPLFGYLIAVGTFFLTVGTLLYYFNPSVKRLFLSFIIFSIILSALFFTIKNMAAYLVVMTQLILVLFTMIAVSLKRKWIIQTSNISSYIWITVFLLIALIHGAGFLSLYSHIAFSYRFFMTFITNLTLLIALLHFRIGQSLTRIRQNEQQIAHSLKEKEVLLKEVHHRVKNNMAVMSSLLSLQSNNTDSKEIRDQLIKARSRIHAMALVHEKLYETSDFSRLNLKTYIESLVKQIQETNGRKIDFIMNLRDINIEPDILIPCGLIINEAITNSVKHGFQSMNHNKISIDTAFSENDLLTIVIQDNGIGLPENFDAGKSKGLGFQLITSLSQQLNAELTIDGKEGLNIKIAFLLKK